jgi:hypothetical protein
MPLKYCAITTNQSLSVWGQAEMEQLMHMGRTGSQSPALLIKCTTNGNTVYVVQRIGTLGF